MNDLQPLLSLLSHAERDRDAALAAQSEAMNRLEGLQQQSVQLVEYRKEYEQRWTQQFKSQGSIEVLRYYQSFTDRLNQALSHQQRSVAQAEQQMQAIRTELMSREMKVASIKKLIERRVSDRARQAERQEQTLTDELAARSLITSPGRLPNSTY
jgi:flagellar FliJ protein